MCVNFTSHGMAKEKLHIKAQQESRDISVFFNYFINYCINIRLAGKIERDEQGNLSNVLN